MSAPRKPPAPATVYIDGKAHAVDPARNLLEVALELGYDLPYFCWHPALGSVGACRQCAVTQFKDDHDTQGRVVMACMTPCSDQTRVAIAHPDAVEMREAVIEYLMINHPHDCPVCEEGGACHLQDMTVMTGHAYRRYRYTKRTHVNQDLGPFVGHEMNRCIACYRCVRFYRDYAGGEDLNVFGAHDSVYFGRETDGTLESPFSGNLVEVCPTGVFTDKTYGDSYTRKWDLQQAPSVCQHCSIGCNITPGERYGSLKRVENRYHSALNGYFLCDRGRYGYGYVNRDDRLRQAETRSADGPRTLDANLAVARLQAIAGSGRVIGVGSPRASLESNFALRELVGAGNFCRGESGHDARLTDFGTDLLRRAPAIIATLHDIEQCDAALVLGEDIANTAPRLALAVRQMTRQAGFTEADALKVPRWQDESVRIVAQQTRSPLFLATPTASMLDAVAAATQRGTAQQLARLGYAVAAQLDPAVAAPADLDPSDAPLAQRIAASLVAAQRPALVTGLGCGEVSVLAAADTLCRAFLAATGRRLQLCVVFPECNSVGTALLGGGDLETALARIEAGEVDALIVLENDLFRRVPAPRLDAALATLQHLVALDVLPTPTTARATLVLPSASAFEADGILVNFEGRAQRYFRVFMPAGEVRDSWRWLQSAAQGRLGSGFDDLTRGCAAVRVELARVVDAAPQAAFRIKGSRIPRQSHRYSGRTAMHAHLDIHEPRPPQDADSPLAFTMEGALSGVPPAEIPIFWYPRWNSVQSVNKFQHEINGPLRGGDPGVRLFEPDGSALAALALPPPAASVLVAVPLHFVFGSDELSASAPALVERGLARPHLALHPRAAAHRNLSAGDTVRVALDGVATELQLVLRDDLHEKACGLPAGVAGMPPFTPGMPLLLEKCG